MRTSVVVAICAAAAFSLVACGGRTTRPGEATPDPRYLVAQASDVPAGFVRESSETTGPTALQTVLQEPWSAGGAALIRRERIAGYRATFVSPEARRIECGVAVYRSTRGGSKVFRLRTRGFAALLATGKDPPMRDVHVRRIGDETRAFYLRSEFAEGLIIVWRYRNVVSSCTLTGLSPGAKKRLLGVVLAQQSRVAAAVGRA
jgi:hypothetical protein